MFKSESFSKKKEERSPIVQRKNGASLTKRGYDDPVKEKPSPKDFSNSAQKAPIQRYLTIGEDDDDDQINYDNGLSEDIKEILADPLGASPQAIKLLDDLASNKKANQFNNWIEAVDWANGYTNPVKALKYLDKKDQLDVHEDDQIKKKIKPGYTINSSEFIEMPLEKVGDTAERLAKKWLDSLNIDVTSEQNNSGHGLDASFVISQKQILKLPKEIQRIFSQVLPRGETTTRYGRKSGKKVEATNEKYLVILEIKANSAQLSNAQKNDYNYVYNQSKKGFAVRMREALDKKMMEIFYEVRIDLTNRQSSNISMTFLQNDEEKRGRIGQVVNYDTQEELSYITPKEIGDIGEKWTREQLALRGYTQITSLQKVGGQGVDVVGLDPKKKLTFFEVKTHLGSGKKPSLSTREKKQSEFVFEIVKNIKDGTDNYDNVSKEALKLVKAIYDDVENNMKKKKSSNIDDEVKEYLKTEARYLIVNVDLPELGEIDKISGEFSDWKLPKNLSGNKRGRPSSIEEKLNKQSPKTKKTKFDD